MLVSNKTYIFLGELGHLCRDLLGRLEQEFKKQPNLKIKLITYSGFAELLNFIFPNNIEAITLEGIDEFKKLAWGFGIKGDPNDTLFRRKFKNNDPSLFSVYEKQIDENNKFFRIKKTYPPAISSPLSNQNIDNSKIINIQAGAEINITKHSKEKNAKFTFEARGQKNIIIQIIKLCLSFPDIKVVVHGVLNQEQKKEFNSQGVYCCENLVESISYLHKSKLTICCHSGFTAFALSCASNVAVLMPNRFPMQSVDACLGNIFQTFSETIYISRKRLRFDESKLRNTISRLFFRKQIKADIQTARGQPIEVMCPVSVGELVDKISILKIKSKKILDERRNSIKKELTYLELLFSSINHPDGSQELIKELEKINEAMWEVNDMKRIKARKNEIDDEFIYWSIKEDAENDRRFEIKKKINILYKSSIIEEKGYDKYETI